MTEPMSEERLKYLHDHMPVMTPGDLELLDEIDRLRILVADLTRTSAIFTCAGCGHPRVLEASGKPEVQQCEICKQRREIIEGLREVARLRAELEDKNELMLYWRAKAGER